MLLSRSVFSDSLSARGLQHARLPCPSSPGIYSNLCPLNQWCHLTISSSVVPFSSCLQSFPASGSFLVSWLFASGGQNIGLQLQYQSFQRIFRINIQDWLTGLISLQSKGLSRIVLNTKVRKHQFFSVQPSLWSKPHIHTWLLEKNIALTIWTFVGKVMSLLFNVFSRLVIAFLARNKRLLIPWLWSPSAVILEPLQNVCHSFHCLPIYLACSDGTGCHDLSFLNV